MNREMHHHEFPFDETTHTHDGEDSPHEHWESDGKRYVVIQTGAWSCIVYYPVLKRIFREVV